MPRSDHPLKTDNVTGRFKGELQPPKWPSHTLSLLGAADHHHPFEQLGGGFSSLASSAANSSNSMT